MPGSCARSARLSRATGCIALFEYEERGFKKYYESHTSGRRNLKAGDAATLYRDTETGKVTEESSSVMLLIIAAVCFSSGIVVTAVMLLL